MLQMKNLHSCLFIIRRGTFEKSSSRLTSTVKPLMELLPSEAVIDIKPEMDDDLIAEDPLEIGTNHGRTRSTASRPTAEIYRPGHSRFASVSSVDTGRPTAGSSHTRQQDNRSSRTSRTGSSKVPWFNRSIVLVFILVSKQNNVGFASNIFQV